jgi:uncharacterized protein
MELTRKLTQLKEILLDMHSVAVAYSGGTDSTLLLKVAYDCLGKQAIGLTAVSASLPAQELSEAQDIARQIGVDHVLLESQETQDPRYLENTPERCYFCKTNVLDELIVYARQAGYRSIVDGTNADDAHDHRPGRRASKEHGVRSPLLEANLGKSEIRQLARQLELPNWDKPAAACLSSRVPYFKPINLETLAQIEAAEGVLREFGLRQLRVRHHDHIARIEVEPDDLQTVLAHREAITSQLQSLGYTYITLDLAGFRSGSLNTVLKSNGQRPD